MNSTKRLSTKQKCDALLEVCAINDALKNWVYDRIKKDMNEEDAFNIVNSLDTNACVNFANDYADKLNFKATAPNKILTLNNAFTKIRPAFNNEEVSKQDYLEFTRLSAELTVELQNFMEGRFCGDFAKQASEIIGEIK